MKPVDIRTLLVFAISMTSFASFAANSSEYGDIIKNTPEYKKITTPKDDDDDDDDDDGGHRHIYHPAYHPPYHRVETNYRPTGSGRAGLRGNFYLGLTIGKSEFDYDDIEGGDASILRFGYRPEGSHLGYELVVFDSGDSKVTSLSGIDIQVETVNLVLTLNSSRNSNARFNLFGQGGIYFADTILTGPFDDVSENSNGFLLAGGVEFRLGRAFSLRAEAYNLFDVEDFASDESVSAVNFGGQIVF